MEYLPTPNIPTAAYGSPTPLETAAPDDDTRERGDTSDSRLPAPNVHPRKRLLLQILDALNELSSQDLDAEDTPQPPKNEPKDTRPDSRVQRALNATGQFNAFRRCMLDLDKELQNLTQAFRQFGSAGIISSSVQLRTRLAKILFLFNLNASSLCFPYITVQYPPENISNWRLSKEPQEFELLRDDLLTFLKYLHEFPSMTDEPLVKSVLKFRQALKCWAASLEDFQGHVRNPIAERYLHDLCDEFQIHLVSMTTAIGSFVKHVVPSIRHVQQRSETTLVSLSGLAAFVSAVTATGIQAAFNQTDSPLKNAVNAFWFSSLVFSVASAVNALLGLAWSQSLYRSPRDRVPWWISIWLTRGPFAFLIAALVTFSLGLALFTWASGQHLITCLLTTIFTGISLFSLLVVSVWFALERSIFVRYKGERLLADVIAERRKSWTERIHTAALSPTRAWSSRKVAHMLRWLSTFKDSFPQEWSGWCGNTSSNDHVAPDNGEELSTLDQRLSLSDLLFSLSSPQPLRRTANSSSTVGDRHVETGMSDGELVPGPHTLLDHAWGVVPTPRLPPPGAPRSPYHSGSYRRYTPEFKETTK